MTIHLYLKPGSAARKMIREAIPQPRLAEVAECEPAKTGDIPRHADFVIHCGRGRPSTKSEFFAAQRGTHLTCLPEAYAWLQDRIGMAGDDITIIDAALHTITRAF